MNYKFQQVSNYWNQLYDAMSLKQKIYFNTLLKKREKYLIDNFNIS